MSRRLLHVERFVGMRYLKSRKQSAFLSKITLISVAGVAVGVWALIVVLSVMAGFEEDLRDKIIGANAHGNILKVMGSFPEYETIYRNVLEKSPEITGAAPFLLREVMITSDSNVTGAILKGIDVDRTLTVTKLQDYLDQAQCHPECGNPDFIAPPPSKALSLLKDEEALLKRFTRPTPTMLSPSKSPSMQKPPASDLAPAPPRAVAPSDDLADDTPKVNAAAKGDSPPLKVLRDQVAKEIQELRGELAALPAGTAAEQAAGPSNDDMPGPAAVAAPSDPETPVASDHLPAFRRRQNQLKSQALPGILIGYEMAKYLSVFEGDIITVVDPLGGGIGPTGPLPSRQSFRIAGLFYSGMYEYDLKFVYTTIAAAQRLSATDDVATGIEYRLAAHYIDRSHEVADRIETMLGGFPYEVRDWKAMNRNLFAAIKMERLVMFIILTFITMVAAFNIASTLIMLVLEKTREIAILKSMGASNRNVMRIFMLNGVVIGLLGTIIGVALGIVTCLIVDQVGIPLDQQVYYMPTLPVKMEPLQLAVVPLSALAICFIATIYPAWKAARLSPVDGLRND